LELQLTVKTVQLEVLWVEIDPRSFLAKLGGGGRELQLGELSKAFCNRQIQHYAIYKRRNARYN